MAANLILTATESRITKPPSVSTSKCGRRNARERVSIWNSLTIALRFRPNISVHEEPRWSERHLRKKLPPRWNASCNPWTQTPRRWIAQHAVQSDRSPPVLMSSQPHRYWSSTENPLLVRLGESPVRREKLKKRRNAA